MSTLRSRLELPEFEIVEPIPPVRAPLLPRRPFVWFGVAGLIVLLVVGQLASIGSTRGVTEDRAELQRVLNKLEADAEGTNPLSDVSEVSPEFLQRAERELLAVPLRTKGALGARERALLIIRQTAHPKGAPDFSKLNAAADDIEKHENAVRIARSRSELNALLIELYRSKTLSGERASYLRDGINAKSGGGFPYDLAVEKIDKLDPNEGVITDKQAVVAGLFLLLLVGGVGAWIAFAIYRAGGGRALGTPVSGSIGDGDDLGLRMLMFLLAFVGLPVLAFPFIEQIENSAWLQVVFELVLMAVVGLLITRRYGGVKRTLVDLGFRTQGLGKDILFGVGAFAANWPLILVFTIIGRAFMSWIPSGEHPLAREFMEPDARLPLLISAVIIAPLLEETTFRGLLFQGLFLRTRSLFWAVFLSGLAFAAIHPQGGALWLSLGWLGAMGALLTHERGSLVPTIVMHALHNGTLLAVSLALR